MQSSVYVFENGLRKVRPYYLQFNTHPKPRWIGRTVVDVFSSEFGEAKDILRLDIDNELMYIRTGFGRKGGETVLKGWDSIGDRILDKFDVICNSKHMHEPSVPECPLQLHEDVDYPSQAKTRLKIVFENEDMLVVDKPSGIPTHPTGNYYYNTMTEILKHDLNMKNVWPFHRLDKVTSGILIFGKSKTACDTYSSIFQNEKDNISKQYLARIEGEFPTTEVMVNCPIFSVNSTGGYIKPLNADMLPINSTTVFKRLRYSKELNQSIVICRPLTGRMHQIRIHLRNIGHPIVNDYLYNPTNDELHNQEINMINGSIEVEIYNRLFEKYPSFGKVQPVDVTIAKTDECIDLFEIASIKDDNRLQSKLQELQKLRQESLARLKSKNNTTCTECNRQLFDTNKDMTDSQIWLHAYKYQYIGDLKFSFQTEEPSWCSI
ncbi:hypothetical protein G9P44_004645 [Scheffersomyces stipitis]|nr:hypothetical protein G9P44_004645 [Scheffersomyces stipitis]